jgi:cold shock CspA family protein
MAHNSNMPGALNLTPSESEARPPPTPQKILQRRITSRVERFDPLKGWGFVRADEIEGDILLYHRVAIQSGFPELKAGTILVCDVVPRPHGHEVVHIVESRRDG